MVAKVFVLKFTSLLERLIARASLFVLKFTSLLELLIVLTKVYVLEITFLVQEAWQPSASAWQTP